MSSQAMLAKLLEGIVLAIDHRVIKAYQPVGLSY